MTIREITKRIQEAVGAVADGVWGKNTADAVWAYIQATEGKEEQTDEPQPKEEPAQESQNWELDPSDTITPEVHRKCIQTLNVFETGSPEGDYSNVSIYKDGGGGAYYQITYGASQTTQDGNLDKLLYRYVDAAADDSAVAAMIQRYLPTKDNRSLYTNDSFIAALKRAGNEPLMQKLQDEFFDEVYFIPAYKRFKENGFTLPLSMLVIYDSFIHSGGILSFLRKRFSAVPPAKGGDEKEWIQSYVDTRRRWLANHSNKVLRNTVYRMDTMLDCIKDDNWMLEKPYKAHGKTIA
jgi:chitosanase